MLEVFTFKITLGINYLHILIHQFLSLEVCLIYCSAFTLVEIHVLLPSYVERFMNESADVYVHSEVFYSLGAILSGVLVYRLLSGYNEYLSIVSLMFIRQYSFFGMSYFNNMILFFTALVLGITNTWCSNSQDNLFIVFSYPK